MSKAVILACENCFVVSASSHRCDGWTRVSRVRNRITTSDFPIQRTRASRGIGHIGHEMSRLAGTETLQNNKQNHWLFRYSPPSPVFLSKPRCSLSWWCYHFIESDCQNIYACTVFGKWIAKPETDSSGVPLLFFLTSHCPSSSSHHSDEKTQQYSVWQFAYCNFISPENTSTRTDKQPAEVGLLKSTILHFATEGYRPICFHFQLCMNNRDASKFSVPL